MRRRAGYAEVPTTLLLDSLDSYVRRRLKVYADYQTTPYSLDQKGGELELESATLSVAEALLLGDGVALKITGENVALAYLVRMFGAHPTAELIRQGVIEFVGQGNEPGTIVDPSMVKVSDGSSQAPGNPMLVTFDFATMEPQVFRNGLIDGEAAVLLAMRRFKDQLGLADREIRELSRRAAKHTHAVPPDRLAAAAKRVGEAYASGALAPLGLSSEIARLRNEYNDAAYATLIQQIDQTETLLDLELDLYQMPETWTAIREFTSTMTSGGRVLRSIDNVVRLRGLPDMRALFRDRILRIEDIPKLRSHPATKAFRRWLWSRPDPSDGAAIAREFVGEVSGRSGPFSREYFVRGASIALITLLQDAALEALQVAGPVRYGIDSGLALLSDRAFELFKRRPPSAFLDEVIQPAVFQSGEP